MSEELTIRDILRETTLDQIEVTEENAPQVIAMQVKSIVEVDKLLQEARSECELASKAASAQVAPKGLNASDAIRSTQGVVKSMAQANLSLAQAQKALLVNQQKMAEGMRFLLLVGASSISMNRMVITQLEAKLKQAEQEELSATVADELIGVIRLLKEQESTFQKQEKLSNQISQAQKEVKSNAKDIQEIRKVDEAQSKKDEEHDEKIEENATKNQAQDEELNSLRKVDDEHEKKFKRMFVLAGVGFGVALVALILSIVAIVI